jgi:hypothetical protein
MNPRYFASKAFWALAALFALAGIVLFHRETAQDYLSLQSPLLDLLSLVTVPRFVPFAASILSAGFGLFYFFLERNFKRAPNILLVLVHLVSFLLATLGHITLVRFWWRVLGDEHANIPLPVWAGGLEAVGLLACCCAFAAIIFGSFSKATIVAGAPR